MQQYPVGSEICFKSPKFQARIIFIKAQQ